MSATLQAILWLAPFLGQQTAGTYATAIDAQSTLRRMDPLAIVAIIHHELRGAWKRDLVSHTSDYGLMQVHVSRTTNADLIGRERTLFDPAINVARGIRTASRWRLIHRRRCKPGSHPWWSHYKWGVRVKTPSYGDAVKLIYNRLVRRFRKPVA
jgi:hypothetical protein